MQTQLPQFDELGDLLTSLNDGELTPAEFDRLQKLLSEDAGAQAYYRQYMRLCALLEFERAESETARPEALDADVPSPLPLLSTTHYPLPTNFVGGPVFSYMVATVVLCLMLFGAWAYKISHIHDYDFVDNNRRSTPPGPSELVFIGKITGMKDCRWSDPDTQTLLGASVLLNRQYALASGLLEITYKSGAKVILEGPCTYKVESDAGGYLKIGKLTARVETKGSGVRGQGSEHSPLSTLHSSLFAVRTPTAIITDLGTEFGVEVLENGNCDVFVFEGLVTIAEATDDAGKKTIKLAEGESARVVRAVDNTIRIVDQDTAAGDSDRFVRRMPSSDDANNYTSVVLADKPLFYWTFNEPSGAAIEQVRRSPPHSLYPRGGAKRCKHSAVGSGLALGRAADFSQAAGAFASGRMGSGDMPGAWAIEFWVQATGDRTVRKGQYIMNAGLFGSDSRYANTNPAVIFNWPEDAAENEVQLFNQRFSGPTHDGPTLDNDRWRHLIMVFIYGRGTPKRVDLVLDGKRRTIDCGKFSSAFNLDGQIWIGAEGLDMEHPFQGRIDELAFYDLSDMSIEQIEARISDIGRRHYEAGQQKGGNR